MIWEGLTLEGLAVTRALHDRYGAARRNPWNEVECGDHYGRSMASYGVYLAACGFEYHGPKRHLGFAPNLSPENFKCAFTSAEGWGTFWQKRATTSAEYGLQVRWGQLRLKTMSLAVAEGVNVSTAKVLLGQTEMHQTVKASGQRAVITFADEIRLTPEQALHVTLT
jgi:hypothetical protein